MGNIVIAPSPRQRRMQEGPRSFHEAGHNRLPPGVPPQSWEIRIKLTPSMIILAVFLEKMKHGFCM